MGRLILTTAKPSDAARRFARAGKAVREMVDDDSKNDVRVVRPVGGTVLGSEQADLVPLPITDDRNQNPAYAAWLCEWCGKFYDACICGGA